MAHTDILELQATILEYEHALEHVAEPHEGACPSCQSLAQSALDRVNAEDFREIVAGTTPPLATKTGKVLTDADIEALADEAERGYDVSQLKQRPSRER